MPYESLTCPKCGSSDSQEVKPGTHFCNYCDNVFRYVPPPANGGAVAACATCGIIAAGLCRACNLYFCANHQAVEDNKQLTDSCAACLADRNAKRQAEKAQRQQEAAARSRKCGFIYLEQSARSELMAARVPLVPLCYVTTRAMTRFGRDRTVNDYNWGQVGMGWLLGEFKWATTGISLTDEPRDLHQTVFFEECTWFPELQPLDFAAKSHRHVDSVIIGRVTGRLPDGRYSVRPHPGELKASYEEVGAAVQQLAGTTERHR